MEAHRMADPDGSGGHVQDLLGSYVLGRLPADAEAVVERHLQQCVACCEEHEYLSVVHGYLAMLTDEDVRELLREVDEEETATQQSTAGWQPKPATQRRLRHRASFWPLVLAAAALALVAGLSVGSWLRGPVEEPVDLVATATDSGSGVSATVVVTPHPEMITIQVTVSGLPLNQPHRLVLVSADGERIQVAEWTSGSGAQALGGTVPMVVDDIGFFAITTGDGTTVLSVPLGW